MAPPILWLGWDPPLLISMVTLMMRLVMMFWIVYNNVELSLSELKRRRKRYMLWGWICGVLETDPPSLSGVERAHTRRAPPAPVHCPVPAWVGLSSLRSPPYPPSLLLLPLILTLSTSFTPKRISMNWGAQDGLLLYLIFHNRMQDFWGFGWHLAHTRNIYWCRFKLEDMHWGSLHKTSEVHWDNSEAVWCW